MFSRIAALPGLIVILALALWAPSAAAEGLQPLPDPGGIAAVTAAGPSWDTFTNRDGTGLYHEILRQVFGLYGIEVERLYVPSERAYSLVREGEADFMTCHDKPVRSLIMARHPMYENTFHVFYRRADHPDFSGPADLEGAKVAVRIGYYDQSNFPVPVRLKEVKTGDSALGMVVLGRADFYVDDANFIRTSMDDSALEFDPADFVIAPIGRRAYRPLFADNEHGRKVMDLYDRGMERLWRTGALHPIFARWGYPLPEYDIR